MTGKRDQTISFALDDRARIPFAMIGVLMLVTSSTVVFYLDTQPEPKPDANTGIAMDRASASAQSAVSDGVTEALQKAAAEPVNQTADTPVGNALDDTDTVIDGPDPMYETFGPYVRLRIYLETQKNLRGNTQRIDNETVSRASLPRISYEEDEIEDAISKVDLKVGRYHDDMESGTVKATVEGIEISVVRNGTEVANRTETMNVTTGTTVFALREKTQTYEDRLNAGFFDSELTSLQGFGQQFGARIYPLAWARAYTERLSAESKPVPTASSSTKFAFHSIIKNYEAETLANDAIFSIQENVYGATDPREQEVMRSAWACSGAKTMQKLLDARGRSSIGGRNVQFNLNDICTATQFLFGGIEGDPPRSLGDLADNVLGGPNSPMEREEQIPVEMFAEPSYAEVTDGTMPDLSNYANDSFDEDEADEKASHATNGSHGGDVDSDYGNDENEEPSYDFSPSTKAQNIIDSTYQVDVSASQGNAQHVSGSIEDPDDPGGSYSWSNDEQETTTVSTTGSVEHTEVPDTGSQDTLHRIEVTATTTYERRITWERTETYKKPNPNGEGTVTDTRDIHRDRSTQSTKTYETTIYIRGDYNPGHDVNDNGISDLYTGTGPEGTSNLEPAVDESINDLISGVSANNLHGDIEGKFDGNKIDGANELESEVDGWLRADTTIEKKELLTNSEETALKEWLVGQLTLQHSQLKSDTDTVTLNMRELVSQNDPLHSMRQDINNDKDRYIYFGEGQSNAGYETPAHHARSELVRDYVANTKDWMEKYVEKRNSGRDQVNSQLDDAGGAIDGTLQNVLDPAQDWLATDFGSNDANIEGSSLLNDEIKYQIDATPTYLSRSPITRATSPEVRPSYAGPETPRDADHAPLAVRNNAWLPVPGLPVVPWPTYWYASVNVVGVQVDGEYARFEVTANTSNGINAQSTNYVRQEQPVTVEINQQERTVGKVTPINFTSKTDVIVVTPGATVYASGNYGPGDRIGNGNGLTKCTTAWGAVGSDFDLRDVRYGNCPNLAGTGSNTISTLKDIHDGDYDDLVEDDDEDDPDGSENECDFQTLQAATNRDVTRLDYTEEENDTMVDKRFCRLEEGTSHDGVTYRSEFASHLDLSEDTAESWITAVVNNDADIDGVRTSLKYTIELPDVHDIEEFDTAEGANSKDGNQYNSHRDGITFNVTLEEEDTFGRIYGTNDSDDRITGGFLARRTDIQMKSRGTLIDDFAIWDAEDAEEGEQWAEYHCLAKVFVPEGVKLRVSTTKAFTASEYPLDRDLDGGVRQFQYLNDHGTDDDSAYYDDENWLPLGSIENLTEDASAPTFLGRYDQADSRQADYTDDIERTGCKENIYTNTG